MTDRRQLVAAISVLATVVLAGCSGGDSTAAAADADDTDAVGAVGAAATIEGVEHQGEGWTVVFPEAPELEEQQQPLQDHPEMLDITIAGWEREGEALAVLTFTIPAVDGWEQMQQDLLDAAAGEGTVDTDTALLDADGAFLGRRAVVISTTDGTDHYRLLFLVDGHSLYQLVHAVGSDTEPEHSLESFAAGFTFDAPPAPGGG